MSTRDTSRGLRPQRRRAVRAGPAPAGPCAAARSRRRPAAGPPPARATVTSRPRSASRQASVEPAMPSPTTRSARGQTGSPRSRRPTRRSSAPVKRIAVQAERDRPRRRCPPCRRRRPGRSAARPARATAISKIAGSGLAHPSVPGDHDVVEQAEERRTSAARAARTRRASWSARTSGRRRRAARGRGRRVPGHLTDQRVRRSARGRPRACSTQCGWVRRSSASLSSHVPPASRTWLNAMKSKSSAARNRVRLVARRRPAATAACGCQSMRTLPRSQMTPLRSAQPCAHRSEAGTKSRVRSPV